MTKPISGNVESLPKSVWEKASHMLEPLKGITLPTPGGWYILCAQYVRPAKVGAILMPDRVRDEDKYQGRCGIVLAIGPDAYRGDKYPSGPWCKVGDWVAWPAVENAASRMEYAGVTVTAIPDDRVVLIGVDPERIT